MKKETKKVSKQESKKVYDNSPKTETRIRVSRDGKWLIHETIITDIKAVGYYTSAIEKQGGEV